MARRPIDVDLANIKVGRLRVIDRAKDRVSLRKDGYNRTRRYWNCQCDCGNTCEVRQDALQAGTSNSCGCLRDEAAKEQIKKALAVGYKRPTEDLTGQTFGRLTVVEPAQRSVTPKGRELFRWICSCSCGETFNVLHDSLKAGKALSCGCVGADFIESELTSQQDVFEYKSKLIHGEKYSYARTEYKHSLEKVCVTCPFHGDFYLTPSNHLQGQGCKFCSYESLAEKQHYSYLKRCKLDQEFSDRTGCVYLVKLTNSTETFLKVGVSCSLQKRLSMYASAGFSLDIINVAEMSNYNSAVLENKILSAIKREGYKYNPITDFVGYTECSVVNGKDYILNMMKEFEIDR